MELNHGYKMASYQLEFETDNSQYDELVDDLNWNINTPGTYQFSEAGVEILNSEIHELKDEVGKFMKEFEKEKTKQMKKVKEEELEL